MIDDELMRKLHKQSELCDSYEDANAYKNIQQNRRCKLNYLYYLY